MNLNNLTNKNNEKDAKYKTRALYDAKRKFKNQVIV